MESSHQWLVQHFDEVVSQYGGSYVAIVDDRVVAANSSPIEAMNQAKKAAPGRRVGLLRVPTEEELVCLL